MALTPEQLAEIQRLKALMQQPATDAQRRAQAIWNAEQIANRNQPPGKSKGGQPMSEKKFNKHYSQHVDIRSRGTSKGKDVMNAIREKGFTQGFGVNTLPPYRGGQPSDVTDRNFAPRAGDFVYLIPPHGVSKTKAGIKVNEGWKPEPHEAIQVAEDYPNMYQEYLKALEANKKAKGGSAKDKALEKFLKDSKIKERLYHGTNKAFKDFDPSKAGSNLGMDREGMFFTSDPAMASMYAEQDPYEFGGTREGANVRPVHINAKNVLHITPKNAKKLGLDLDFDEGTLFDNNRAKIIALAKMGGHDAVKIGNDYISFDPSKIKSAISHNAKGGNVDMDQMRYAVTMNKGGRLANIPLHDIEHGESATPGGKLTWPKAHELIKHYASLKTEMPPIDVVSPDEPHGKWMIADGSHRYEAAKLRGMTHIKAKISPHDKEGLEYIKKYKADGGPVTHAHHLEIEEIPL